MTEPSAIYQSVNSNDVKTGKLFLYDGEICKIRHRQNCGKGATLLLDFDNPTMPMCLKLSTFLKKAKPMDTQDLYHALETLALNLREQGYSADDIKTLMHNHIHEICQQIRKEDGQ